MNTDLRKVFLEYKEFRKDTREYLVTALICVKRYYVIEFSDMYLIYCIGDNKEIIRYFKEPDFIIEGLKENIVNHSKYEEIKIDKNYVLKREIMVKDYDGKIITKWYLRNDSIKNWK